MAKHRRYHGAVEVNLGDYASFERSVGTKDVLIGLGLGIVGAAAAAFGRKKLADSNPTSSLYSNPYLVMGLPIIGGGIAGFAAWMLRKQKNRSAAYANLIGAVGAGAALAVWPKVATAVGFAGDWMYDGAVGLDIPMQGYEGMLVDDSAGESNQGLRGFGGMLVDDQPGALRGYADRSGMGRLAAASLDADEDYSELARLSAFANYRELDIQGQG